MSIRTTIYVRLLDEGVDVRRPVLAEQMRNDIYRIDDQDYDRETETWEFLPRTHVVCKLIHSSEGQILAAVQAA